MTQKDETRQTPYPNPFSLARTKRFYRQHGMAVEIDGGRNMYILKKEGDLWVRIVYLQDKNECLLDSWQPDSMPLVYWRQKRPYLMQRNCWWREKNHLPQLEQVLQTTLEILELPPSLEPSPTGGEGIRFSPRPLMGGTRRG